MRRSLSALLPVRNGEAVLSLQVEALLEILPELTPRFEIVVIDDGSSDGSLERADDLAPRYPQIRVLRHGRPLGRPAALRTGLRHSSGDILFLRDEACALALDPLARLWQAAQQHEVVLARPAWPNGPQWLRGGTASRTAGYQFLRRAALEALPEAAVDQPTLRAALARRGWSWCEIEVPARPAGALPARPARHSRVGKPAGCRC